MVDVLYPGLFSSKITFITLQKAFFTSAVTSVKISKTTLSPLLYTLMYLAANRVVLAVLDGGKDDGRPAVVLPETPARI